MGKKNINFSDHYISIIVLLVISFFVSYSYFFLQYGIDGGLILANKIKYPDFNSPMVFYYLNSWTSIHQISYLLIKLGFSVAGASKFLMFVSTSFFSFGAFLFSFSITKKKNLSLLIAITAILLGKNFGDTDYPSLIFSEHTYGMMSIAFVTFSLGLISNKNYFIGFFLLITLISIHPVIGAWLLTISLASFFFLKSYKYANPDIFKGFTAGLILVLISFVFFYINSIDKNSFDQSLFDIYLNYWDGHRIVSKFIHYEYILKTALLGFLTFVYLKIKNNDKFNNNYIHLYILLISLFSSLVIYFAYKIFPNLFPEFLKIAMPSRFIMLHTFLGWPIIISFLFYFLNRKFKKINFSRVFLIFLSLIIIQNFDKIFEIKNNVTLNFKDKYSSKIIEFVKKENFDEYILTSSSITSNVFKNTQKPILLHTESMDFIPYHPYLVDNFFDILSLVYKINNDSPPQINNPSLPDDYVKKVFENHKNGDWKKINTKYNIKYVVTPINWELNLNLVMKDSLYKLYEIL